MKATCMLTLGTCPAETGAGSVYGKSEEEWRDIEFKAACIVHKVRPAGLPNW